MTNIKNSNSSDIDLVYTERVNTNELEMMMSLVIS